MRRSVSRSVAMALGFSLFALTATGCFQVVGAAIVPTPFATPALAQAEIDATNQAIVASTQVAFGGTAAASTQIALDQTATASSPTPSPTASDTPFITPTDPNAPVFAFTATTVAMISTSTPEPLVPNTVVINAPTQTPQPTFTPQFTFTVPATFTPQFTFTPLPTYTIPPTYTKQPTYTPPAIAAVPDQPIGSLGGLIITTLEPGRAATIIAAGTIPPDATLLPDGGIAIAQVDPSQATAFARATQIIATITAAAQQTVAASGGGSGLPVNPATAVPNQGNPPLGATPTQLIGVLGTPGSGASGAVTPEGLYTVAAGDRLFRIAIRFGIPLNTLIRANGITSETIIVPGQVLRIPGYGATATPTPQVIPPNAVTQPANSTLDPKATIIIITATPPGRAGGGSGQLYVVREGDTLYAIAVRYGVSVTALAQINGITTGSVIYIGQQLIIP